MTIQLYCMHVVSLDLIFTILLMLMDSVDGEYCWNGREVTWIDMSTQKNVKILLGGWTNLLYIYCILQSIKCNTKKSIENICSKNEKLLLRKNVDIVVVSNSIITVKNITKCQMPMTKGNVMNLFFVVPRNSHGEIL